MPGYNNQHLINGMIYTFLTEPFPDKGPETDEYKATVDLVTKIAVPVHEHIVSWWNSEGGGVFIDELVKMDALDPLSGYLGGKIDNDTLKFNPETFKLYVNSIPVATNTKKGGVIVGANTNSVLYIQGDEIMARVNTQVTLSASDTEIPSCRAVKLYVDGAIQSISQGGGIGDMLKSTYDTNNNGIVDDSEKLNNQAGSYYLSWNNHTGKPSTFPPSAHEIISHTASGLTIGHFLKATSSTTYGFAVHGLTATDVGAASYTHAHGNITNTGAIGTEANLPLITGTVGIISVGAFGTSQYSFCEGNDSRVNNGETAYGWGNHASANYHTGTGNSGYLAKYIGPYIQANSIIYDDGTTAQVGSITSGGSLRAYSTEGAEECPELTTGNWTLLTGWRYLTNPNRIEKYDDGSGAATVLTGVLSVINTIYKIEITVDSITGGTLGLAIGNSYIDGISTTGTKTFYRTALTTVKFSITPSTPTMRSVISYISIKPLMVGTGDVIIDGKLLLKGDIYDNSGSKIISYGKYEGLSHVGINSNPVAGYRLAVGGGIYSTGNIVAVGAYLYSQQPNTRANYITGLYLLGSSAATVTYQSQWSPIIQLSGYAWNTTPTASSKANSMFILVKPVPGLTTYPTMVITVGTINGVVTNQDLITINHLGDLSTIGNIDIATGKTYNINGTPHTHDLVWQTAPASKTSTGTVGQIAKDLNYFYICIATNTWARVAMATTW